MSLAIRAWWPDARYDAAALDPNEAEWPPAPGRLFSALRASARTPGDLAPLEWLEQLDPPVVYADEGVVSTSATAGFVVTNAIAPTGGNLTHPGRTNGRRSRVGSHLTDERVVFGWPNAEPTSDIVRALLRLAVDVPYLGRSTSAVVLTVDTETLPDAARWEATMLGAGRQLAVPYAGFTAELDDAHDLGARAWERYRYLDYAHRADPTSTSVSDVPEPIRSPYGFPLVLWLLAASLPGTATGHVTTALRRAVMSLVGDPLPPEIHGHGADGRPHVAYTALLDVGHRHAAGQLLAIAIWSPATRPEVAEAVARAVLADDVDHPTLSELSVAGVRGPITLFFDPARLLPLGGRATRWTRPSCTWSTATPLLLDRYPRRGLSPESAVVDSVLRAGYPEPIEVEVSTNPFTVGVPRFRPHQVPRKSGDHRPYRHVRLTFAGPVDGPVLIGALRHLGFGLCVPSAARSGPA